MKSALVLVLGFLCVGNAVSATSSEYDALSLDDIKIDKSKNRPLSGEVKGVRDSDIYKIKDDGKKVENPGITVVPNKAIVTGPVEKPKVDRDEPILRSVKSDSLDTMLESLDKAVKKGESSDKTATGDSAQKAEQASRQLDPLQDDKANIMDKTGPLGGVGDSILKAVEEKERQNLRGETAKIKTDGKEESESTEDEVKKDDPIMKSLEGAEQKLSEAFGAVRSKLGSLTKDHKPIKVDCGTTRVRVVCSKKKEGEKDNDDQDSDKKEDSSKESGADAKKDDKKSEDKEKNGSDDSEGEEVEAFPDEEEF